MMLTLSLLLLASLQTPSETAGAVEPKPVKERLVCQRETPIGSLIARRKICLTKTEWERRRADGNEEARRQAYDNMGRPACNGTTFC